MKRSVPVEHLLYRQELLLLVCVPQFSRVVVLLSLTEDILAIVVKEKFVK